MSNTGKHCVVIGAGIVGSCCAWQLARDGHQVTLIDREMPGQATSFGNAACISPAQVVPFNYPGVWKKIPAWLMDEMGPLTIRWKHFPAVAPWLWKFWRLGSHEGIKKATDAQAQLMGRARDDYAELLGETGLGHYLRAKGLIVLYDSRADFEGHRWEHDLAAEYGYPWDFIGPQELKIMAPAINMEKGVALYIPSWQHTLDPGRMTADIADDAIKRGVRWVHDEVRSVEAGDGGTRVNLSSEKTIEADHMVIAAGPWSNLLAGQLDYTVPMTAKRGYHSMIAQPGIELDYPVMSGSRVFVMTPLSDGLRLSGTAEFARLDAEPNYKRARILVEHARHYMPELQAQDVSEWMGQRPMMADSTPVISASPNHPGVIYAFGHGHYGLTQGPTTGKIVADMIGGRDAGLDLAPYRFDRFRT